MRQQVCAVHDETFESSQEHTFQLSYCEDHQHPAVVSVKLEHTVMTNELAHGLSFWSASRYLYDVTPSTSHMNLKGKTMLRDTVAND